MHALLQHQVGIEDLTVNDENSQENEAMQLLVHLLPRCHLCGHRRRRLQLFLFNELSDEPDQLTWAAHALERGEMLRHIRVE